MITNSIKLIRSAILLFSLVFLFTGCKKFSEWEIDESAGINGGFEVSKNGLPVNWPMYTPNTVPNADFKIALDQTDFKEGMQSLRFDVKQCVSTGGWFSPGFTNEFFEAGKFEGEGLYQLSFWIKNIGASYRIKAGGVSPYKGEMKTILEGNKSTKDWEYFEFEIRVPEERHLRMELNILQPGTFWIDDVQITQK